MNPSLIQTDDVFSVPINKKISEIEDAQFTFYNSMATIRIGFTFYQILLGKLIMNHKEPTQVTKYY